MPIISANAIDPLGNLGKFLPNTVLLKDIDYDHAPSSIELAYGGLGFGIASPHGAALAR
jgi:hypothetical protein